MLWYKTLHIIFMITWFAGLFYLPRLFVYHAMSNDQISLERFKVMERKLFWGIMTPGAILTIIFGILLIQFHQLLLWLQLKIFIVGLLVLYHIWCGKIMYDFKNDRNNHSHIWYRVFNEIPVIMLIVIIYLVVFKPF
ncbi:MAG: protoporphyrinogen oxidase HemJ [Gammaproteobacteria bacterium]|jgi:protoporphyrinogen IX oxidase|nr:protoporphyrinogen oxidase HemJ [Gammaproteobacteria bacterium]MBT4462477.1 protoporphyrinogen oxidase HemJ [Gammaproteobacteria bacterium]MBT4655410.1 protoporphyrinogen oxidase HemJ [Gammaproteobacteria bacterium]MBT5406531.1 protoporphyrinogen oxidase HemJ [Gammaproteobacteria bacterium]MBT5761596.1 protoporphyrinogen oxidase HemJ [Gammaproteobacteria bacterium]